MKIYIINPGKIGTHTLSNGLRRLKTVYGFHNLKRLNKLSKNNCLFIIGIREPVSRHISYFFELINNKFIGETEETFYIGSKKEIEKMTIKELYTYFLQFQYKYSKTYIQWYYKLFEILQIKLSDINFDKEKGIILMKKQNYQILFYTLEKLDQNKKFIANLCNVDSNDFNENKYQGNMKWYSNIYKKFKDEYNNKIKVEDSDLINHFY